MLACSVSSSAAIEQALAPPRCASLGPGVDVRAAAMDAWQVNMRSAALVLVALFGGAASLVAQRTWVVDTQPGPGVDFTDIQPAVAAAAAGDRIEIRNGGNLPPSYAPFTVDKSLDLVAAQGAYVAWFRIENLAAGGVVTATGLRCRPAPGYLTQDHCVMVRNCAGTVLLRRLEVRGVSAEPFESCIVRDAAVVTFQDCLLAGRSGGTSSGTAGLAVQRSNVSVVACQILGGHGGGSISNAAGYDGGSGLVLEDSAVFVADTTLQGGTSGYGWAFSGSGGHGVLVLAPSSGRLEIAGGQVVRGIGLGGAHGEAVVGPAIVTADCAITGGVHSVVVIPPITSLTATAEVPIGGTVAVALGGATGAVVAVALDLRQGHQVIAGIREPLLLSPAMVVGAIAVLPAPTWNWLLPIPNSLVLQHRDVYFQAASSAVGGGVCLTQLAVTRLY